jgi:hypothetical protein
MCLCVYVCMCVYVCVCVCACACMHVHVCMCLCLCMCVCVRACVCVCMKAIRSYYDTLLVNGKQCKILLRLQVTLCFINKKPKTFRLVCTWIVPLCMASIWLSCSFSTWRDFRKWKEVWGMEWILLLLRSRCCRFVSGRRASAGMLVMEAAKPWDTTSFTNECPTYGT